MWTEPLARSLDVRRAAARGAAVCGAGDPQQLPRFRALLAEDSGTIAADLAFSRDEENRFVIRVSVSAEVQVVCQRCLQPMPLALAADNTLAVVWNDEQARQLPRSLEPLILGEDEDCSLWDIVEDELILGLPAFSYHDTDDCKKILAEFSAPPAEAGGGEEKSNPFNVLAQLKPGDNTRS